MTREVIAVSGIMLRRSGLNAIVSVDIDGTWHDVIVEPLDANFSHIVEPRGIQSIIAENRVVK